MPWMAIDFIPVLGNPSWILLQDIRLVMDWSYDWSCAGRHGPAAPTVLEPPIAHVERGHLAGSATVLAQGEALWLGTPCQPGQHQWHGSTKTTAAATTELKHAGPLTSI